MEKFKDITHEELKKWVDEDKDFILIDVLGKESYEARHLPEARHASVHEDDFLENTALLAPDREKPVVVYCASFSCQASPAAADKLIDAGYTNVYDFAGGLADWADAGYSFEGSTVEEKA